MTSSASPISAASIKLATRQIGKPWGRLVLPAPFSNASSDRIGEIWFEAEQGPALPLMVKYLFTSEKLSIQVHPNDAQAQAMGQAGGKEECWLVLDAEPGATLGIGTKRPLSDAELRAASLDGSIEQLVDWKPVERGDFFYIPAGTIHAIGAGVSLIEVQQNADITFRLYDYGRPRELHLDQGVTASRAVPFAEALHRKVDLAADQMLVEGPHFALMLTGGSQIELPGDGPLMIVPVKGSVTVRGKDSMITANPGECLAVSPGTIVETSPGARLLVARACKAGNA